MLNSLFPILLFISLGYFAKRVGIFEERDSKILIDFIIYFSFPAIVFSNIYFLELDTSLFDMIAAGWIVLFAALLFSFLFTKMMGYDRRTSIVFILMASFGNTAFVGIPFVDAFYQSEGVRFAILYDQFVSFILVSLIAPLLVSLSGGEFSFRAILKRIFLFPPFIALLVAVILKPFSLPSFLFSGLDILGSTVVPLALFAVGFGLNFEEIKSSFSKVLPILSIKIIIIPILFIIGLKFLGISFTLEWKVAVMQSAMPPMVYAAVIAMRAGLDKGIAISSVGLGVVVALLVLPIYYLVL